MTKLIQEDIFTYLNYNPDVEEGARFAVPNEIFTDLQGSYKFGKCAYGYTYYYLSMYLHLYAKYGIEDGIVKFSRNGIQQLLGISPTSSTMLPITKKNGFLDKLGYTSTVTDYPVELLRLEYIDKQMEVHHYMYSEEKRDFPDLFEHGRNFTVKHPDKMYWRTKEDKVDSYLSGTINEADNTHIIPLEIFLHAMNIDEIMTKGFYVYGFILYKSDKNKKKGWRIPMELFQEDLQVSRNTLKKILKSLEEFGFITVRRQKNEDGIDMANTYFPNLNPLNIAYPE